MVTLEYGAALPPPKRRKLLAKTIGANAESSNDKNDENSEIAVKNE